MLLVFKLYTLYFISISEGINNLIEKNSLMKRIYKEKSNGIVLLLYIED